ncbi:ribonuclease PH [Candidatus Xiphinematobacter sp. Idaho Grape]|uniref:ribonuclease PH n=1 Tax=Candidatus Xiphinematobacter sp. Idaho Grape TaxID=1704307 RepID=UPI000784B14B|nr:ribonuclease PH [Candidatus Xiphinematobacter sp. Idaho Grape]
MTRKRSAGSLREIKFQIDVAPYAVSSVLVSFGNTQVICATTVEHGVPKWIKEQGIVGGWITAEYSMLPYSTTMRKPRDSIRGRQDGRGVEIQRLIGRALRAAVNREILGSRTLWVDCDVLQADGGTRAAAITGSWVAVYIAIRRLFREESPDTSPTSCKVAAVSLGIVDGKALLDLDYEEDKRAEVDLNLVMTDTFDIVDLQASGEKSVLGTVQLDLLLKMGRRGIQKILELQQEALIHAGYG